MLRTISLGALLVVAAATSTASAQAKLSEPAVVSQTIDGTKITLEYGRPSMRGRAKVFGGEVHWDEVWTPGANWATTFEVDRDVTLEGRAVPKGRYSLWLVVKEQGEWTLLLASEAKLWHTNRPKAEQEFARIPVTPRWGGAPVETLTWDFPVLKPDRAVLRLQWAGLELPLRLAVQPSKVLTAEQRARVVGTYALERASGDGGTGQPERTELRVTDENGRLRARFTPALAGRDAAFDLFAVGSTWFWPVYTRNGVTGAEADLAISFELDEGKVKAVEVMDADGRAVVKGKP
jgi:hypothetical protein